MKEIKEEHILEDKEMRQELINRVEVLDKVKKLILLSKEELTVMKLVAEYFEVSYETIKKTVQRNESELELSGMKYLTYAEMKEVFAGDMLSLPKLPTRGGNVFSRRAVLNIGMLLQESKIALEVRQQLLNIYEEASIEQKAQSMNDEEELLFAIMKSKNPTEQAIAVSELNNYHNRHKAELNVRIDEMKPKEEAFDTFISTEGYQKMNDVAKSVGYGRNKMFQFLRDQKILMRDNRPYQSYINRGWFTVKQNTIVQGSFTKNHAQTYASPKGIDGISKLLKKHGLID